MSEHSDTMNGTERRAILEQRAEVVRSRLERRLDELDERRDHLVSLARKATEPPINVILIGAASLVGVAFLVHRLRRPSPSWRTRAATRVAPVQKQESFVSKALKGAALSLVATLAQRLGTRGIDRLLPEVAGAPRHLPEVPRPRGY